VTRCQLITAAGTMIKSDFPAKWPQFMNQIMTCLASDNAETWSSSLLVFYTLVQHYEYKKVEDRGPMDDVMVVILPLLQQRFMQLFAHDDSDQSALIQKQILKIFHAYTQVRSDDIRLHEKTNFLIVEYFSFILAFKFYQLKQWHHGSIYVV